MLISIMTKSVYIRTFGCQMNVHDSEKIIGILREEGYSETDNLNEADLVVFNTCSIRQKAEQKFYSELGRIRSHKKRRPSLRIAVAGCIARQEGKNLLKKAPHVDFILGPQNISRLKDIAKTGSPRIALEDDPEIALIDLPAYRKERLKAWVSIAYGCNNFCSYCIVPFTRGRERSRPSENIYREVCGLAEKGCTEITLLGQNVNSYRNDTDFPGLLRMLNYVDGIERIRFVTSHPKDLSGELISAISELPKVCEHIHLPLQSGSDNILRRMKRGYTYRGYMEKICELREKVPCISVTSDIIAGFPGESHNDHMDTLKALREIEFDGLFAFKYSPRPLTRAAAMQNQLPEKVKSTRLDEILKLQDSITLWKNKALEGTLQEILVDGRSAAHEDKLTGRTRSNKIVDIPDTGIESGSLINVEITKSRKHSLEGIPAI
jgi:tRNA-2-methylthio-N6-dimethylallyladenosine synthase